MRVQAIQDENGLWGVGGETFIVYESQFSRITAEAIADMENSENPPKDWKETKERLKIMGLPF